MKVCLNIVVITIDPWKKIFVVFEWQTVNKVGILQSVKYSWKDMFGEKVLIIFSFWGSRKLQNVMNSCEEKSRGYILVGIGCWIQEILIVLVVVFSAIKYVKVCKNVWEKFWLILT